MIFTLDKENILTEEVFRGLDVNLFHKEHLKNMFYYNSNFHCVVAKEQNTTGYMIFNLKNDVLRFYLFNFLSLSSENITERIFNDFLEPFCKVFSINKVLATAEREAMAFKLKKLGFINIKNNFYELDLNNVS